MVVWCGHGSSISSSISSLPYKRGTSILEITHFSISCLNGCFSGEFGAFLLVRLPLLYLKNPLA
jgi:hypothetical protein